MTNRKNEIKIFTSFILSTVGFHKGKDFKVGNDSLWIINTKKVTGKILITLKENFPEFNFYWKSSRLLVWF